MHQCSQMRIWQLSLSTPGTELACILTMTEPRYVNRDCRFPRLGPLSHYLTISKFYSCICNTLHSINLSKWDTGARIGSCMMFFKWTSTPRLIFHVHRSVICCRFLRKMCRMPFSRTTQSSEVNESVEIYPVRFGAKENQFDASLLPSSIPPDHDINPSIAVLSYVSSGPICHTFRKSNRSPNVDLHDPETRFRGIKAICGNTTMSQIPICPISMNPVPNASNNLWTTPNSQRFRIARAISAKPRDEKDSQVVKNLQPATLDSHSAKNGLSNPIERA